jgi:hypothetical protein
MADVILLVTWFYAGQPPAITQVTFPSLASCEAAQNAVLSEAQAIRDRTQQRVVEDFKRGFQTNPSIPTASAICMPR